jgi:hypothetical protein
MFECLTFVATEEKKAYTTRSFQFQLLFTIISIEQQKKRICLIIKPFYIKILRSKISRSSFFFAKNFFISTTQKNTKKRRAEI